MTKRVCLDLFCGLGGFSAAFEDSEDWRVVTVDVEERFDPDVRADVLDLRPGDLLDALGEYDDLVVLASPPCEEFSPAQNLNGDHEPAPEAIALVYHALGLIKALRPDYWVMENPRGRLRSHIGRPEATVTYCQYGEDHMKPTDLWGEHPPGLSYLSCSYGDSCHINHREGSNAMRDSCGKTTSSDRAVVPYELSKAIRDAVDSALDGETLAQASVADF